MANTQDLSMDTIVQWDPEQITAEVFGEVVAMSVLKGQYVGLDSMATNIWRRLEHPQAIATLCAQLSREFQGDPETISKDVIELLRGLHHLGMIAVVDGTATVQS